MELEKLLNTLKKNPIIPCTSNIDDYSDKSLANSKVILLYDFSIFDINKFSASVKKNNKFTIKLRDNVWNSN